MNNLYTLAYRFSKLLKKADGEIELDSPEAQELGLRHVRELERDYIPKPDEEHVRSKRTPTEYRDPDKGFFIPLAKEFRVEISDFKAKVEILLSAAKIIQGQINQFVSNLETIHSGLSQANNMLAVAQMNKAKRAGLTAQAYEIFLTVFPAAAKAENGLNSDALQAVLDNFSAFFSWREVLQSAYQKIDSLQELSRK